MIKSVPPETPVLTTAALMANKFVPLVTLVPAVPSLPSTINVPPFMLNAPVVIDTFPLWFSVPPLLVKVPPFTVKTLLPPPVGPTVKVLVLLVNVPAVMVKLLVTVRLSVSSTLVPAKFTTTLKGTPAPDVPGPHVLSLLPTTYEPPVLKDKVDEDAYVTGLVFTKPPAKTVKNALLPMVVRPDPKFTPALIRTPPPTAVEVMAKVPPPELVTVFVPVMSKKLVVAFTVFMVRTPPLIRIFPPLPDMVKTVLAAIVNGPVPNNCSTSPAVATIEALRLSVTPLTLLLLMIK